MFFLHSCFRNKNFTSISPSTLVCIRLKNIDQNHQNNKYTRNAISTNSSFSKKYPYLIHLYFFVIIGSKTLLAYLFIHKVLKISSWRQRHENSFANRFCLLFWCFCRRKSFQRPTNSQRGKRKRETAS